MAGDAVHEIDERFTVNLTAPTNATLADAVAQVMIGNDDALPVLAMSGPAAIDEGTGPVEAPLFEAIDAADTFVTRVRPISRRATPLVDAASISARRPVLRTMQPEPSHSQPVRRRRLLRSAFARRTRRRHL